MNLIPRRLAEVFAIECAVVAVNHDATYAAVIDDDYSAVAAAACSGDNVVGEGQRQIESLIYLINTYNEKEWG